MSEIVFKELSFLWWKNTLNVPWTEVVSAFIPRSRHGLKRLHHKNSQLFLCNESVSFMPSELKREQLATAGGEGLCLPVCP